MHMRILIFLSTPILQIYASYKQIDDCSRGSYSVSSGGSRVCLPCPRGVYGATTGLTTSACTAPCPMGKYSDVLGIISEDDCKDCPAGTYGATLGLTSKACSGSCGANKYSLQTGLSDSASCVACVPGYFDHENCFPQNVRRTTSTKNKHAVLGSLVDTIEPLDKSNFQ